MSVYILHLEFKKLNKMNDFKITCKRCQDFIISWFLIITIVYMYTQLYNLVDGEFQNHNLILLPYMLKHLMQFLSKNKSSL